MADYQSSYTGAEIDAGIAKANTAIQDISGKQDILVSGTNIKTINNESVLGSGNLTIQGGGTTTDVQINGTTITSQGVANIVTETAYNASTNKIATMADVPSTSGLANTNLSNITDTGKIFASSIGLPSDKYDTMTIGASGTKYEAPSNGWFVYVAQSTSQTSSLYALSTPRLGSATSGFYQMYVYLYVPILKGEEATLSYSVTPTSHSLLFVYAEGSKSEYVPPAS